MKKELFSFSAAAIFIIIFSLAFVSCTSKEEETKEETTGAPVKLTNPRTTGMTSMLQLTANTVFLKKEIVRSPFAGYIQKSMKNIGDRVAEGEILFFLQTKENYAINSVGENKDVRDNSSVPVKAKSNGVLTQLNYHPGDYIAEGEQIAAISNPNSLKILLNVPYRNLSDIKIGSACKLCLPDGKMLDGKIFKSIPSMDAASQTQAFLIECAKPAALPENMNLLVKIPLRYVSSAIALPKKCVLSNETLDEFWIMKLINDKTAVKIPVTKGIENDTLIQIVSPKLNANDKVILEGGYGLADTAKVIIER